MAIFRMSLIVVIVALALVTLVAGQQQGNDKSHEDQSLGSNKLVTKLQNKKLVKANRLSKTTTNVTDSLSPSTGSTATTASKASSTTPASFRAVRQNAQSSSRRVLRGYSDNQSQASSPKHTYALNEQDDEYFSRRRARFLFRSRVGK